MSFRCLAIRKLSAVGLSGVVGVSMALSGFGVWSLVGQQITGALVSVVMLWAVTPWRPSLRFSRQDFRELFGFGIHVVGGDILNFFSRNIDNLLIGVVLGPVALGFYAVAYRVLDTSQSLLINAARKLVFPVFVRLQHDRERMRRAYSRMNRASSALTLPGYIGLALVAQEAIVVLFGNRWIDSGPVAAVLYLIGPVLTIQAFSGALFNAVGHPEVTLRFRLVTTVVNVTGFVIAVVVFRDILAVAAFFVLRGYLLLPLNLVWMRRYGGIPIGQHILELRGVAGATLAMAVVIVLVKLLLMGHVHNAVLLMAEIVSGVAVFGVALVLLERALVADIVTVGVQAFPGGRRVAKLLMLPVNQGPAGTGRTGHTDADPAAAVDPTGLATDDDL
jgi:PST family polysaccharide transporter